MAVANVDVVAIFGPTGAGKSDVAEIVADALGTEVVSADALQVYRELPLLTNQPARPTRLVAIRSVGESMSVGEYAGLAHASIDELVANCGSAVVVGGTGLYLRAALTDLRLPPPAPAARERWEKAYDHDPAAAHAELAARDPAAAELVHVNDRRRVVRALELSDEGWSLVPERNRLWSGDHRRPTIVFGLVVDPAELERRIRERTSAMFANGVVHEVSAALELSVSVTAEKALGLTEIAALPREEAVEAVVVRTRRYAAYQRKWMRRIPGLVGVDAGRPVGETAADILARLGTAPPAGT